jgi:hypothetical protein
MSKSGVYLSPELVSILRDGLVTDTEVGTLIRAVLNRDSQKLPEKFVWLWKMAVMQQENISAAAADKRGANAARQRDWRERHKLND